MMPAKRPPSKPWLWLPPKLAHDLAPIALSLYADFHSPKKWPWKPLRWRHLEFANRAGIAGGVDKNGAQIEGWWSLGAGFLEIGTVTPRFQGPNPGKIIDRDVTNLTLWNKMGFPNDGLEVVMERLSRLIRPYHTPILVNIGKNRTTSNEDAHKDYIECVEKLSGLADGFVINISSPNTTGLRELQNEHYFARFLSAILEARKKTEHPETPVLLKLSPDLSAKEFEMLLTVSLDLGIDGWVLTNTTTERPQGDTFPQGGGLAGRPLAEKSKQFLQDTIKFLGDRRGDRLLISVGGILTPEDVFERLEMGADLVEVYSALIFEGPRFFKKVADAAKERA